ncbi:MAG: cupin domain-containing protein [Dehalococcoidia bacterium]
MEAFVIGADEGQRYALGGGDVIIKAMPEQTGIGGFAVETFPAGFATPYHIHHRDDGVFYLLDGSMRIKCGQVDTIAHAGSTIFLPRGVPHAFRVEGASPARWFNVQSPHGDFMLQAIAFAGSNSNAPATVPDAGSIELLGPPPF